MNRRSLIKSLALVPLAMALPACKPKSVPPTAPPLPEKPKDGDYFYSVENDIYILDRGKWWTIDDYYERKINHLGG